MPIMCFISSSFRFWKRKKSWSAYIVKWCSVLSLVKGNADHVLQIKFPSFEEGQSWSAHIVKWCSVLSLWKAMPIMSSESSSFSLWQRKILTSTYLKAVISSIAGERQFRSCASNHQVSVFEKGKSCSAHIVKWWSVLSLVKSNADHVLRIIEFPSLRKENLDQHKEKSGEEFVTLVKGNADHVLQIIKFPSLRKKNLFSTYRKVVISSFNGERQRRSCASNDRVSVFDKGKSWPAHIVKRWSVLSLVKGNAIMCFKSNFRFLRKENLDQHIS